jgi:hypothetical protein
MRRSAPCSPARATPNPPAIEYTLKRADQPTVYSIRDFQFKQLDKKPADFLAGPRRLRRAYRSRDARPVGRRR